MFERLKRYWINIVISAMVISPGLAKAAPTARTETAASANIDRPNVLVVVIDDVGYSDLGCYGGEIHTPNIDRLARDGVRYIRFDTNAVCSATRASLLTGRNSQTVKMSFLAASDPSRLQAMGEGNPQLTKFVKGLLTVNPGWRDPKDPTVGLISTVRSSMRTTRAFQFPFTRMGICWLGIWRIMR